MATTINIRAHTRAQLKRRLGAAFSAREEQYTRLVAVYLVHYLFTQIHKAFLVKSKGGRDEFGNQWKPLARSTIAQRPIRPGERKALGIQGLGRGGRGLLTAAQNRQWKAIFASNFKRLSSRVGEAQAKQIAAKLAWAILKSRGAKTKLEVLGGRKVPILIVSHDLERSLKPGHVSREHYDPSPNQVFSLQKDRITIGTEVEYASRQHKHRRLWPTAKQMLPWVRDGIRKGITSLLEE